MVEYCAQLFWTIKAKHNTSGGNKTLFNFHPEVAPTAFHLLCVIYTLYVLKGTNRDLLGDTSAVSLNREVSNFVFRPENEKYSVLVFIYSPPPTYSLEIGSNYNRNNSRPGKTVKQSLMRLNFVQSVSVRCKNSWRLFCKRTIRSISLQLLD